MAILLWEKRDEEAWQEANEGGCSRSLWLSLAQTREITHPVDAIHVYKEEVHRKIEPTSNGDYSESMIYLNKLRKIMSRTNQSDQFRGYVLQLRSEFKRKRNLIKLLDQHKFPA